VHILATRTFKHSKNAFLLYLGTAYLFVAIIDVAHTMTYYGMNVLPGYGPNTPTQLWIAGRFIEAVSLFLALTLASRPIPRSALLGAYTTTTIILLGSIMWSKVFPVCFIEGQGLTAFKIAGEYAISILLVGAILQLRSRREQLGLSLYRVMVASMAVNIVAELSFTLYTDVYGIMNFVGHMARLIAFYLIYRGVVIPGIDASYNAITTELKTNAVSDYLTGLYNRRGLVELARQAMGEAGDEPSAVGVLLMDLDQFKIVNDLYGHLTGDRVLRDFAALLRSSVEGTDLACRLGGDEFVALLGNASEERTRVVSERIREAMQKWAASDEVVRSLGVSIGSALWEPGSPGDIETLLKVADERMYQEKQAKKARV
jgi:diguanylate cyclase (GGDEF)-like protein